MNKKLIYILIFFNILFVSYSEKWVGQAATYQLVEGSKIATGGFFTANGIFAACNGFKLGAEVAVTNVTNGNKIKVVINDRVSEDCEYFMLLTPGAAKELGLEWETALIVVDALFSDINSIERLPVKGLVKEGQIDLENLKRFPEVVWPEVEEKIVEQKIIEQKEEKKEEESKRLPEEIKEFPQEDFVKSPEKHEKEEVLDVDIDEVIKEKKRLAKNVEKKASAKKQGKIPEKVRWFNSLPNNGIYVRVSTCFDKAEGVQRLIIFKKIFSDVIGVREGDKYILFAGPVRKEYLDVVIAKIRKYGYKDAYVVSRNFLDRERR